MTSSIGGGAVNLATLWVPVLPEVSGFASSLAEGVVGGATMAVVNKFLDIFGEMTKKAVEGITEIAKGVYEIGEQFQTLEYQVESYTDAQGAQLESLKDSAAKLFSQLDTGTKNLGENMDIFHQRLGLMGSDLEKLTYDYTELESRLGNLDPRAFTAALDAYGVSGDKADAALRTLAADAQHYGDTMQNLTANLETANPVFDLLGVSFNGAADAMGKIDAIGPNAMKVMNGIAMAGKAFAKMPDGAGDFRKFISDAIDTIDWYNDHNEKQKAQQFAFDTFGVRQTPIVLRSLKAIKEGFEGVGDAGRTINVDKFVEDTRKLDQMWELFIHKVEYDLKPVGDAALEGLETGVEALGHFLQAHESEIVGQIQIYGDTFIQQLPAIQHFVGEGIRFLGMFFEFMKEGAVVTLDTLSEIIQAYGWITGNDKDRQMGQGLMDMANDLNKIDFSKVTDPLANAIENAPVDTNAIQKKWDTAMGNVLDNMKSGNGALGRAGLPIGIKPKAPDGTDLTDSKQLIPGLPPDGLHIPVVFDPKQQPDGKDGQPSSQPSESLPDKLKRWFGITPGSDWTKGLVGFGDQKPGASATGNTTPGIVHTGDPSDPVHVALSAYSVPLGKPGGGYGEGGGGPDHSANQGFGSVGPTTGSNDYDAPMDWRNQEPSGSKKNQSPDPGDLVGPLFDALGFGNVLGGPNPENLGIVKLLKGVIGWMNTPPGGAGAGGVGGAGGAGGSKGGGTAADILGLGKVNTGPHTMLDDILSKIIPGYGTGGPGGADGGAGSGWRPAPGAGIPGLDLATGKVLPPGYFPAAKPATSFDSGGTLLPGDTSATNQTGKAETVVPPGASWVNGKIPPLIQKSDGTWTSSNPAWAALINRESSGITPQVQHGYTDVNTGGNEAQGLFQITPQTWKDQGGLSLAPSPNQATPQQQGMVAARLLLAHPSGSDWGEDLGIHREDAKQLLAGLVAVTPPAPAPPKGLFGGAAGGIPGMTPAFSGDVANNPASQASRIGAYLGQGPGGTTTSAVDTARNAGAFGSPPIYAPGTKTGGYANAAGTAKLPSWMVAFGAKYGLIPSTYPDGGTLHAEGYAADFAPKHGTPKDVGSKEMDDFAQFIYSQLPGQTMELIHAQGVGGPNDKKWGIAGGVPVGPGTKYPGYDSNDWLGHADNGPEPHVHWATDVPPLGLPGGPPAPGNVSSAPNVATGPGPMIGGAQQGANVIHGDYMPINVTPSAIDPRPAVKEMQNQQNSLFGSAGSIAPQLAH